MSTEIIKLFSKLQMNKNFKRAGKLFSTRNNTYFYDSGTGKVFICENSELKLLKLLLNNKWNEVSHLVENDSDLSSALENIYALVEQENILKLPVYSYFTNENSNESIYQNESLKQLTLEVTQKCNLRCKYCIYNEDFDRYREFGTQDMSWDIAKAALDYANENGSNDLIIGFYGGEPLMNYNLIKNSIEYCLNNFHHHSELYFTITSNLTLLTEDMAEYLSNVPNMNIVCSLDGPKNIQDKFRVFPNAVGSFDQTIRGLKLLCKKMGDEAVKRISIHSVLCPPFDEEKMNELNMFFQSLDWLPKLISKNIAYVGAGSLKSEDGGYSESKEFECLDDKSMNDVDPVKQWALNRLSHNKDWLYAFQLEHSSLMKMHTRSILDVPAQKLFRNACCTAGIRKLYVCTDGNLSVCERIGNSPSLGNIKTGLDLNVIMRKYIDEYDAFSLEMCNNCWALHLCNNCYAYCYNENGLDEQRKIKQCEICRKGVENDLIEYYQLMEENPLINEYLDQIIKHGS